MNAVANLPANLSSVANTIAATPLKDANIYGKSHLAPVVAAKLGLEVEQVKVPAATPATSYYCPVCRWAMRLIEVVDGGDEDKVICTCDTCANIVNIFVRK